ncbi:hypothetical protein JMJ77_0008656 [Colletotrichum scovillei]|uniref:Uncharacterized protein n=1 Tax=Colletotrichum scovillei TaxID=1209932 RepID=A0A9P7REK8_9PEZI|nr:hypothetical protein JMJ77_0008656 [Colletotrichum scovillei]KAG7075647.1 hypothetical protein JMJ76_0012105 [Colletotrichum scovillei]KAG7082762.1 hypothetical protein JMJ78_0004861 [Colletotrichum scovillei]
MMILRWTNGHTHTLGFASTHCFHFVHHHWMLRDTAEKDKSSRPHLWSPTLIVCYFCWAI